MVSGLLYPQLYFGQPQSSRKIEYRRDFSGGPALGDDSARREQAYKPGTIANKASVLLVGSVESMDGALERPARMLIDVELRCDGLFKVKSAFIYISES